jgi:hypothetical protein
LSKITSRIQEQELVETGKQTPNQGHGRRPPDKAGRAGHGPSRYSHKEKVRKMKPDYVKIIFIGIPATFLFWVATFICSIVLVSNTGIRIPIWINNSLTVLFIPTYLFICRKFANQLRCQLPVNADEGNDKINKSIPQTNGIIALVTFSGPFGQDNNAFSLRW